MHRLLPPPSFQASGWERVGQLFVLIVVTNHIDGFGGSHNDGITWLRGESGIRFGSQLITWSKY